MVYNIIILYKLIAIFMTVIMLDIFFNLHPGHYIIYSMIVTSLHCFGTYNRFWLVKKRKRSKASYSLLSASSCRLCHNNIIMSCPFPMGNVISLITTYGYHACLCLNISSVMECNLGQISIIKDAKKPGYIM